MNGDRATLPAGKTAAERYAAPRFVGRDGMASILILLVAASNVGDWVQELPVARFLVRALWWLLYLGAFARLVQRFGAEWCVWMMRRHLALCLLLMWALLSSLWSLVPLPTLQKAVSLVGTTVLGVYIGYALPPSLVARVLSCSFAAVIVPSLVALPLLADSIVAEPFTGDWRGLMNHRNSFGAMAAIASLFFMAGALRRETRAICGMVMCGTCLLVIPVSGSRTALVACVVGMGTFAWFAALRRTRCSPRVGLLLLLALLGATGAAATYARGSITQVLGRDSTFSGRVLLWEGAVQIIRERPLTGYGYHTVWGRKERTLLPHVPITADLQATTAHSAVLHTATELGVPGAVLLAVYWLGTLLHAGRFLERRASSLSLFVVAFVFATAIMNITESYLLHIHSVFWILFVAFGVMLERSLSGRGDPTPSSSQVS